MPRFEKGSKEALEWAAKMKKAREAKKGMKGGVITDTPFGMPTGGKKLSLKRDNDRTPSPPKKEMKKESPAAEYIDFKSIASAPTKDIKPTKPKAIKPTSSSSSSQQEKTKKGNIVIHEDSAFVKPKGKGMTGGYLQPGEIPLASTSEAMIADKEQQAPIEMSAEEFITEDSIDGAGMCKCRCEMCGGKISTKSIHRGLTRGLAKAAKVVNPMTYALGNKTTSNLMGQSGQFTTDYALPAVTTAGLPLYYGAAGTAGMLVGGPVGSMAATKAADTLWQEMVAKRGADPRERQKSKTLGVVSGEVGKLGASQLKQGASGKGVRKSKKKKLIIIE